MKYMCIWCVGCRLGHSSVQGGSEQGVGVWVAPGEHASPSTPAVPLAEEGGKAGSERGGGD